MRPTRGDWYLFKPSLCFSLFHQNVFFYIFSFFNIIFHEPLWAKYEQTGLGFSGLSKNNLSLFIFIYLFFSLHFLFTCHFVSSRKLLLLFRKLQITFLMFFLIYKNYLVFLMGVYVSYLLSTTFPRNTWLRQYCTSCFVLVPSINTMHTYVRLRCSVNL